MAAGSAMAGRDDGADQGIDRGPGGLESSRSDQLVEQPVDAPLAERKRGIEIRANHRLAGLYPQHLEEVVREVVACSVGEIVEIIEALIDRSFQSGKFSGSIEGVVTRFFRRDIHRVLASSTESFHFKRWDEVESQVADIREALEATQKKFEESGPRREQPAGATAQSVATLSQELGAMRERMEWTLQEFLAPQSAEVQGSIEGLEGRIEEVREEARWYTSRQVDALRRDFLPMTEDIQGNSRALEVLTGRCIDIANRVDQAADSAVEAAAAAKRAERSAENAALSPDLSSAKAPTAGSAAAAPPLAAKAPPQEIGELVSSPSMSNARLRETHPVKELDELESTTSKPKVHKGKDTASHHSHGRNHSHQHHDPQAFVSNSSITPSHNQHHHHNLRDIHGHHTSHLPFDRNREAAEANLLKAGSLNTSVTSPSAHGPESTVKGTLQEYKREVVHLGGRLDEYMARMEAIREELQLHTIEQCQAVQEKITAKMESTIEAAVSAATETSKQLRGRAQTDSSADLRGNRGRVDSNASFSGGGGMIVDSRGHRHHAAGHTSKVSAQHSGSTWQQPAPDTPSQNGASTTSLDSARRMFVEQLEGAEARRNRKASDVSTAVASTCVGASPAEVGGWTERNVTKLPSPKESPREEYDGPRLKRVDSQDCWSVVAESARSEAGTGLPGLQTAKTMPALTPQPPSTPQAMRAAKTLGSGTPQGNQDTSTSEMPDRLRQRSSTGGTQPSATSSSAVLTWSLHGRNSRPGSAHDLVEAPMRLPPMEKPAERGLESQRPRPLRGDSLGLYNSTDAATHTTKSEASGVSSGGAQGAQGALEVQTPQNGRSRTGGGPSEPSSAASPLDRIHRPGRHLTTGSST